MAQNKNIEDFVLQVQTFKKNSFIVDDVLELNDIVRPGSARYQSQGSRDNLSGQSIAVKFGFADNNRFFDLMEKLINRMERVLGIESPEGSLISDHSHSQDPIVLSKIVEEEVARQLKKKLKLD